MCSAILDVLRHRKQDIDIILLTLKKLSLLFLSILFVSLISKGDEEKSDLWSLVYPEEPTIPKVTNEKWVKNSVDSFILKKIEDQKLEPTQSAKKDKLVRRVYLDLLGVPPTLDEVESFHEDKSPTAWGKLSEQLLSHQGMEKGGEDTGLMLQDIPTQMEWMKILLTPKPTGTGIMLLNHSTKTSPSTNSSLNN